LLDPFVYLVYGKLQIPFGIIIIIDLNLWDNHTNLLGFDWIPSAGISCYLILHIAMTKTVGYRDTHTI
jgi:hypothetical protein